MKRNSIAFLLLALGLVGGCSQPAADPAPNEGGSSSTAPADSNQTSAVPSGDVTVPTAAPPAPAGDQAEAAGETSPEATADAEAAPTLDDFGRQLMAALRERDMNKALEIADAAVAAFPDSMEMKVNRLVLRLRGGDELAETDQNAAAEHYLVTAEHARELLPLVDKLPEGVRQVIPFALFNEARALALQGKSAESIQALEAAFAAGMERLDGIAEDSFFAKVREDADFQATLTRIREALAVRMLEKAKEEIAQQESFPFDFDLPDLDDKQLKLADLKGKLVIVDIWGTWCPPCRMEIPHFVKLQEAYANDLAIVGINYENGEGAEVVDNIRAFAKENSMNYTCVIGDDATREQVPKFEGFPTTLFLDREGKVRLKVVGYHPYEQLEAYVKTLLAESPAAATN